MIMTSKIGTVAANALTAANHSRRDEAAIPCRVVTRGTPFGRMDFADSDVWGGGGCVASDTVGRERGCDDVLLHLGCVIMVVVVEVAAMTIGTRPTVATVDCRITVAVGADCQGAGDIGVAEETAVFVDDADWIANVTIDAKGGCRDGCCVVMAMRAGEVIDAMALDASGVWRDSDSAWSVEWILQVWRCGVAVAALVGMDSHWVVCRVAANTEGGVEDVGQAACRVINGEMGSRGLFVHVAVQTLNCRLIGVGDHHRHCDAGGCNGVDVTVGVMALDTAPGLVDGQDFGKSTDRMAVGTGLRISLPLISCQVDLDGMVDGAARVAVIMTIKERAVAGDTFSAATNSGGIQSTVCAVVTGGTTSWRMGLTGSDEWRCDGAVATGTVACGRRCNGVFLDLDAVVVGVGIKVRRVAVCTGAAIAAVDRGISMAVDSGNSRAVFWGVTEGAAVVVDYADGLTCMAGDTERGWLN